MKKIFFLFILCLNISGCDVVGSFTFKVKNSTQETITLKFVNKSIVRASAHDENKEEVILLPMQEKVVRIVEKSMTRNDAAHDCLTDHGIAYFNELVFDTYINGDKLEKQLWQAENWTYNKKSKWTAEYEMTITNQMIEK